MELELNAKIRQEVGSNKLKTLRQKGFIPGVVYGPGHKPISIQIDYQEFKKVFEQAGESTIIKLKVKSPKIKVEEKNVLIHDVAKDPVNDKFIHIDFYQVQMDKVITTEVGLVFENEAPAVKNLEGTLIKNITEVEVEALPKDLPHEIKVDISLLETFDDQIRISDLKLPQGVKVLTDLEEVVALVTPPRTEKELAELEEKIEEEVVKEAEKVEGEKEEEPVGEKIEEKPTEEAEKPKEK